jgi:hypothetical protein
MTFLKSLDSCSCDDSTSDCFATNIYVPSSREFEYSQNRALSLLLALFLFTAFPIFLVAVKPTL